MPRRSGIIRLGTPLLFSLLFHVVLYFWLGRITPDYAPITPPTSAPIEIVSEADITPETKPAEEAPKVKDEAKEKQIAESEDANNREKDPDAKYLSDKDQKAQLETRAKAVDDFREKKGTGLPSDEKSKLSSIPPTSNEEEKSKPETTEDELADSFVPSPAEQKKTNGVKRDWKTLSLKDLSVNGDGAPTAASDDNLAEVPTADRTVLSTREFKFYGYYSRIKQLLRQYWKPNVEEKITKLWSQGKSLSEQELTTKVLVLLDQKGSVQKISRLASSGLTDVDDAAIEAFQQAAPFPNPPTGMIDADGFVRIRWDFILKAESGPVIQFQSAGTGRRAPLR